MGNLLYHLIDFHPNYEIRDFPLLHLHPDYCLKILLIHLPVNCFLYLYYLTN